MEAWRRHGERVAWFPPLRRRWSSTVPRRVAAAISGLLGG